MKKNLFILILLFGVQGAQGIAETQAQTPGLKTWVRKSSFTVGEEIRVLTTGHVPDKANVAWPQKIEDLKGLTLVSSGSKTGRRFWGRRRFTGWFVFKAFEPGEYEIPSVSVKVIDASNNETLLSTQKIEVRIIELVQGDVEKARIKDIKGTYKPWPGRTALLILILIASLGAWFVYAKITTKPLIQSAAAPAPPHAIALERIKRLVEKDLISRGLLGEFYFELSMIVRQYLEARFSLRAPEMTTEEFLLSLRDSQDLSLEHKQLLRDFLSHCDMVKFAKYGPQPDEIYATLGSAKKLIEETIPHDVP